MLTHITSDIDHEVIKVGSNTYIAFLYSDITPVVVPEGPGETRTEYEAQIVKTREYKFSSLGDAETFFTENKETLMAPVLKLERQEESRSKIAELKQNLADTDYLAIKYAEGLISEEEYESIGAQRQAWRDEINSLQI